MNKTRNRKQKDEKDLPVQNIIMDESKDEKISFQDKKNICILTFLYILQGIPLGLAGSVPLILQSKKVSYSTQATFSFVFWPFSLKILWAPLVDSIYSTRFGRRKTWLIPAQYLIGLTMMYVSRNASQWLSEEVDVARLTGSFFLLNFLAATQDIAVDGWALTMLSRNCVGWASTCNSVGQTMGYFIAFIVFLALESAEFCNTWLRSTPGQTGLVTFDGFLQFWGIVFMITTTLLMLFKNEISNHRKGRASRGDNNNDVANEGGQQERRLGMIETYETLWKIVKMRPIYMFIATLMLIKLGFSASDSLTGLKLIESGVSKEKMAFIGSLIVPVQILLALVTSKYTTGSNPLDVFIRAAIPRLAFGPILALLVYVTPMFRLDSTSTGTYPTGYYVILAGVYCSHQIVVYPMFVSLMAFYARISDPAIGGTFMTLLNTVTNLAGNIPNTAMLYLIDHITFKRCAGGPLDNQSCSSKQDALNCTSSNPPGQCQITFDGYYLEVGICTAIGFVAILARRPFLRHLQNLPLDSWRIFK